MQVLVLHLVLHHQPVPVPVHPQVLLPLLLQVPVPLQVRPPRQVRLRHPVLAHPQALLQVRVSLLLHPRQSLLQLAHLRAVVVEKRNILR